MTLRKVVLHGLDIISMTVAYSFIMFLFLFGLVFAIPTMYDFFGLAGFDTSYLMDIITLSLGAGLLIFMAHILAPDIQTIIDKRKLMKSNEFKLKANGCCSKKSLKPKTKYYFECNECQQTFDDEKPESLDDE